MDKQILVVEDEVKLAQLIADYLQHAGFNPFILNEGTHAVSWVKTNQPQLILLDLMLPGMDGIEICKQIRTFSNTPLIMVTARIDEIDRLLGLELGADDYICKPFSPREVVARVKAVLRRTSEPFSPESALLQLDKHQLRATFFGEHVPLTAIEFQLLAILVDHPHRIFSRSQLMDKIYQDHRIVSERTIDSHIKKIRKKLATINNSQEVIHSVYGAGYKFEG
ncbi:response regulator [Zooshikella ganghwensis]|uniref:response regulator n=1 Tax=Zooshikella ganghwensis TaxID=202772 RepID=UPI00040AA276|nr:response regulator [Zooshikella ganghwensis]